MVRAVGDGKVGDIGVVVIIIVIVVGVIPLKHAFKRARYMQESSRLLICRQWY